MQHKYIKKKKKHYSVRTLRLVDTRSPFLCTLQKRTNNISTRTTCLAKMHSRKSPSLRHKRDRTRDFRNPQSPPDGGIVTDTESKKTFSKTSGGTPAKNRPRKRFIDKVKLVMYLAAVISAWILYLKVKAAFLSAFGGGGGGATVGGLKAPKVVGVVRPPTVASVTGNVRIQQAEAAFMATQQTQTTGERKQPLLVIPPTTQPVPVRPQQQQQPQQKNEEPMTTAVVDTITKQVKATLNSPTPQQEKDQQHQQPKQQQQLLRGKQLQQKEPIPTAVVDMITQQVKEKLMEQARTEQRQEQVRVNKEARQAKQEHPKEQTPPQQQTPTVKPTAPEQVHRQKPIDPKKETHQIPFDDQAAATPVGDGEVSLRDLYAKEGSDQQTDDTIDWQSLVKSQSTKDKEKLLEGVSIANRLRILEKDVHLDEEESGRRLGMPLTPSNVQQHPYLPRSLRE